MTISPIQRGVPIPPKQSGRCATSVTVAVWEMMPGQFRSFSCDNNEDWREVQRYILNAGRRMKYKLETRKLNGTGVGAWRIK